MRSIVLAVGVCSGLLVAQDPKPLVVISAKARVKVVDESIGAKPSPVFPASQSRVLSEEAPRGVRAPRRTRNPWFGALEVGGRTAMVILAEERRGHALFVDSNGDGEIGDDEKIELEPSRRAAQGTIASVPVPLSFPVEGGEVSGTVVFSRSGELAPIVTFQTRTYLEAPLDIGGQPAVLAVVDEDLDGVFGSAGDAWWMANPDQDRAVPNTQLIPMTATRFGGLYRERPEIDGEDVKLALFEAKQQDAESQVAMRERVEHVWARQFDLEREGFVKDRGVDTRRPRDKNPIQWNYVTFDEGLAMAKESGKLLFADAMAFWCVWCYRLDYYTYPDDEVAALMTENFVPLKIIEEQDPKGDKERVMNLIRAQGIPAMGIVDGDGNLVHTINGWMPPKDFVRELKSAISKR